MNFLKSCGIIKMINMRVQSDFLPIIGVFMDKLRFYEACTKVFSEHKRNGIGTLSEKTVHAVLKNYFETDSCAHEVKIGPYFADIVGEDGIVEIQTRNFSKLRPKLTEFLKYCNVTVVYPCSAVNNIICFDPDTGEVFSKRRSPVKCDKYTVFYELEGITDFLLHPNFRLCIMLMETDEYRCPRDKAPAGQKKKRRKNAYAAYDKRPKELLDEIYVQGLWDWLSFLPDGLPEEFTVADMAERGLNRTTAGLVANVYRKAGILIKTGTAGRAYKYKFGDVYGYEDNSTDTYPL